MTDNRPRQSSQSHFRDRLIAVDPLPLDSHENVQQELHAMFVRELSTPRRVFFGFIATIAVVMGFVCGFLAITEPELPMVARIALGTGSLFGMAWAYVSAEVFCCAESWTVESTVVVLQPWCGSLQC